MKVEVEFYFLLIPYQSAFVIYHSFPFLTFTFPMQRINPDMDIVMQILVATRDARPMDAFVQSLLKQYQERGGLSKKQLQGLHGKASRVEGIPPHKLATLEAIILRKPTKSRSELPPNEPAPARDESVGKMIDTILEKYPQHKRVIYFKARLESTELSSSELTELQKFFKLLIK
jgi:hypothetical protein